MAEASIALDADQPLASDEACAAAIARVGAIDRDLAAIETRKGAAVAAAAKAAEDAATPLQGERARLGAAIEAWCTAHRARLTSRGAAKTVAFATGSCSWRLGRPGVAIDETLKNKILAALKRGRLSRFIKVSESISKSAILAATDGERRKLATIKGIAFTAASEAFLIDPEGAELAARPPSEGAA